MIPANSREEQELGLDGDSRYKELAEKLVNLNSTLLTEETNENNEEHIVSIVNRIQKMIKDTL